MQPASAPDPETLSREQLEAEVRQLRAQSASLAQMFEQAPSFIALLSGPEHRFTLTNAAYQRSVDHRAKLGCSVAEALPDAAAQGYVDLLDEVFRTGRTHRATGARYDVQAVPGGPVKERYLDFVYQPITDAHGTVSGIFVEGHDVTERTLAEAALRENEARYRTLFESIEGGFCIVEMKFEGSRAIDYRIVEANPAFVQQTGADVAGKWVSEFAPDLERHWFDTYGCVALTGEPAHFEHYADVFGRWFDVRALRTGDLIHVNAVLRLFEIDPSERQQFPAYINLSKMFANGELLAHSLNALCGSGRPLTTRELAVYVIAERGWDQQDAVLKQGVAHRLVHALSKAKRRGAIASPGYEKGVRVWSLTAAD